MNENEKKVLQRYLEWWKSVTKYEESSDNGPIVVRQIVDGILHASVEVNGGKIVKATVYKVVNCTEEEHLDAFLRKDRKFLASCTYVPDRVSVGVNADKGATFGLIKYLEKNNLLNKF